MLCTTVVLVLSLIQTQSTALRLSDLACKDGFTWRAGWCYKLLDSRHNHTDAAQSCRKLGAFVAEPRTARMNRAVQLFCPSLCWIGLERSNSGGYRWIEDKWPTYWQNWDWNHYKIANPNEPLPDTCVFRGVSGEWRDGFCQKRLRVLCQMEERPIKPDDCYFGESSSYKGTVNVTVSGRVCQRWESQSPHSHNYSAHDWFTERRLPENYCRNSVNEGFQPWCFTTDPFVRWEYCNVTNCLDRPGCPCGIHHCRVNSSDYFLCDCAKGYKNTSPKTCVDIDECSLDEERPCGNRTCLNEPGTFKCGAFQYNEIPKESKTNGQNSLVLPKNPNVLSSIGLVTIWHIGFYLYIALMMMNTIMKSIYLYWTTESIYDISDSDDCEPLGEEAKVWHLHTKKKADVVGGIPWFYHEINEVCSDTDSDVESSSSFSLGFFSTPSAPTNATSRLPSNVAQNISPKQEESLYSVCTTCKKRTSL